MSFKTINEVTVTKVQCDLEGKPIESTREKRVSPLIEGKIRVGSSGDMRLDIYMFDSMCYSVVFLNNPITGKEEIHYSCCEFNYNFNAVFSVGVSYGYTMTEFCDDSKDEESVIMGVVEAFEIKNNMTPQGGSVLIRSRVRESFIRNYLLDIEIISDGDYDA